MPNINSPRYQRWYVQEQTTLLAFNNSSGTWANTGAQLIRLDQGSVSVSRNAPYSRFPVLTGTRTEIAGIRGRKLASFSIRGVPVIPSGAAGTVPDGDKLFKNMFGKAATIAAGVSATYAFDDNGYFPFSLLGFIQNLTTLTQRALWGCYITGVTFSFNGQFLTMDLEGFAGYLIDNVGFSVFDAQAKAGLTTFPVQPSSPSVNGQPIAGFGSGYTCTIDTQDVSLKMRALSISYQTGFIPIADVYGSPYLAAVVGGTRQVSINLGNALDDDTAQLNDLKTKADTDNTTINATIVAGNVAGSTVTFNVNNIQPNAFNLRDNGSEVAFEMPTSMAHGTSIGAIDDSTIVFT